MFNIERIGIIGAGQLGSALGEVLTTARVQVRYYDKEQSKSTSSLEDLVQGCPVILLCVPSWEVKTVLKSVNRYGSSEGRKLVICFAKGVESGFKTMDQLMDEELNPNMFAYGVMYGPTIAEEIARGRSAHGVMAVSNQEFYDPVSAMFARAHIYTEPSSDMHGVTICSVLKNIYAIAFGMHGGLHLGLNAKGKLAVLILSETKQILADLGGAPATAETTAGLGDLIATSLNENSFNFRVGRTLVEGIASEHIKSEGLIALQQIADHMDISRYPILNAVNQTVFHYGDPKAFMRLIQ